MNASWRSEETENAYKIARENGAISNECPLCKINLPKKEFKHWRLQPNLFPYDRVAKVHDLLYTIRHVNGGSLNDEEIAELNELKSGYINDNYQHIVESVPRFKSIPNHFHLHLIIAK